MLLITDSVCVDAVLFLCTAAVFVYVYFKWSHSYWKRKNLPYIPPGIPFGNLENPLNRSKSIGLMVKDYYDYFRRRGMKHGGVYSFLSPVYVPVDTEYVRNIMARDFSYFVDRGSYYNEKDDPLSAHLFSIGGTKWRNLRAKLTPTFTSGKMKMMFPTLLECGKQLEETVENIVESKQSMDIKEVIGCFTTDIIGSCAFGLECNSIKDPNSSFRYYGKKIFQSNFTRRFKIMISSFNPNLARFLGIVLFPKDVTQFFRNAIRDTVSYRERNNFTRNDFLQILIGLKSNSFNGKENEKHDGKSLTENEMAAQAFVFFIAGFETSSTTVSFCLAELAQHQEIQQKLREEINNVLEKYDGKITYEALSEMKYMGMVLDETLRKYPAVPLLTRQCVQDYKIPNENIVIEKETKVFLPVLGLHYDPELFKDPEKFDPERFSDENKKNIRPFSYIPFGEGPRLCIGMRFGLMQSKVALTVLLKNYKYTLNPKTETPLKLDPKSFIPTVVGGIWLDVEKIM